MEEQSKKESHVNTDNIGLGNEGIKKKTVSDRQIKNLFIIFNLFLLPLIAGSVGMLGQILFGIYSLIRDGTAELQIWFIFLSPMIIAFATGVFILTRYVNKSILRFKKDGDKKHFIKRIIVPMILVLIIFLLTQVDYFF